MRINRAGETYFRIEVHMGNQISYKRHFNTQTNQKFVAGQKNYLKDFLKMVIKRNQRGGSDKVLVKKV